jgi:hypothetical protein
MVYRPHPLTLLESYRFKKQWGEGVSPTFQAFGRSDVRTIPLSPLTATLTDAAKLSRLDATHTQKQGGGGRPERSAAFLFGS